MTKFNSLTFLLLAVVGIPLLSVAQPRMGAWGDTANAANNNYYIDYVGGRVSITAPASIAGPVTHTISNDGGGGTNEWGGSIKGLSSPILNVDIVKADPYEACGTLNNAAAMVGKVALIKRGNCEFGAKALAAQNAGAVAVIIVNQISGPPVGMGAGAQGASVTIPVIMVSDLDGAEIENTLANEPVTFSMAVWSNGYNNDIGILDRGLSLWHAYSVPFSQVSGGTSSLQYNGINGAVIGNFGTATSTNTKLKATLKWTPTGGSTTVVRSDSMTIASFAPGDSILSPFMDMGYNLNPTTTGRYDVEYELEPSFTDQFAGDNKASYSFYVDNRIFSKGRYDFSTERPYTSSGSRFASGNDFLWGPMYYIAKAGYQIEHVKFSISNGDPNNNSMAGKGTVYVSVWKWADANSDSVMVSDECTLVGLGSHAFGATDTSGQVQSVAISDALNPGTPTVTEANTWYWVAASVPGDLFMGIDGVSNYFVRSWIRHNATAKIREPFAPLYNGTYQDFFNSPGTQNNVPAHYPFERFIALEDSIKFSQQKNGYVPSLPVSLSLFKVGVEEMANAKGLDISIYPNPVTDVMNVSLKLDEQATEVQYAVLNSVGSAVMQETHRNVANDTYTVSTAQLAAGTYYLVINVDGEMQAKKFTVIK